MALPVALKEVVEELDMVGDTFRVYIDRKAGELVSVSEEPESSAELDAPGDDWPDWQVEEWEAARRALNSEDFIPLPSAFEIHEWSIMERFAQSLENDRHCETRLDAIHGKGAFGRFKRATERLGLRERWYKFHQEALAEIAIEFLKENGILYTRD